MLRALITSFPVFACLFWSCLVFLQRKQDPTKRYLLRFMLTSTLLYFCHCAYFNNEYIIYKYLAPLYTFAQLAVFQIFNEYVKSLTGNIKFEKSNRRVHYFVHDHWPLIPAIVFGLTNAICYLLMSSNELNDFIAGYIYYNGSSLDYSIAGQIAVFLFKTTPALFILTVILCFWDSLVLIKRYNARLAEFYSNNEGKGLNKTKWLLICTAAISMISMAVTFIGRSYFVDSSLLTIPSVLFGSMLFVLGLVCSKQTFVARDFEEEVNLEDIALDRYNKIDDNNKQELRKIMIDELMESKQIFKQVDIRITDVAMMLGTNRSYLSQTINKEYGVNFATFINHYRVEYAKKMLLQNTDLSESAHISRVIVDSGFSGESTFYRVFKEETGYTPKQWIRKNGA